MSVYENANTITVQVRITDGVPAVKFGQFATWDTSSPGTREVVAHVPGAAGAPAVGIIAMKPDTRNVTNGLVAVPMAIPDGSICIVQVAEAGSQGDKMRVGGNSTEVDGAAYLANAQGDYIVGTLMEDAAVGDYASMQFLNTGLVP